MNDRHSLNQPSNEKEVNVALPAPQYDLICQEENRKISIFTRKILENYYEYLLHGATHEEALEHLMEDISRDVNALIASFHPEPYHSRLGSSAMNYPPIAECVFAIAKKIGAPVPVVAAALLAQAQELNMSEEEIVYTQYRTAMGIDSASEEITKLTSR